MSAAMPPRPASTGAGLNLQMRGTSMPTPGSTRPGTALNLHIPDGGGTLMPTPGSAAMPPHPSIAGAGLHVQIPPGGRTLMPTPGSAAMPPRPGIYGAGLNLHMPQGGGTLMPTPGSAAMPSCPGVAGAELNLQMAGTQMPAPGHESPMEFENFLQTLISGEEVPSFRSSIISPTSRGFSQTEGGVGTAADARRQRMAMMEGRKRRGSSEPPVLERKRGGPGTGKTCTSCWNLMKGSQGAHQNREAGGACINFICKSCGQPADVAHNQHNCPRPID